MMLFKCADFKIEMNEVGMVRIVNLRSSAQVQFMLEGPSILLRTKDVVIVEGLNLHGSVLRVDPATTNDGTDNDLPVPDYLGGHLS